MAVTAQVLSESPRSPNNKRCRLLFTDSATGATRELWPVNMASSDDAQVVADAMVAKQTEHMRTVELDEAVVQVDEGVLITDIVLKMIALPILKRRAFRRILNSMRPGTDRGLEVVAGGLKQLTPYTNAHIANILDLPNWTAAKVGTTRTKAQALVDAADGLDHGEPEVEE